MHVDPQVYDLAEWFVREHEATAHLANLADHSTYLATVAGLAQSLQVTIEDWFADLKVPAARRR